LVVKRTGITLVLILLAGSITVWADTTAAGRVNKTGDYAAAFAGYTERLAEKGDVRAQVNAGWMYYYGEGVRQDKAASLAWYRKAAGQGDVTSLFNLGYAYEHGEGVGRDMNEARIWYGKAAERVNSGILPDFERLTRAFITPGSAQRHVARAWALQKRVASVKAAREAQAAAGATEPKETPSPVTEQNATGRSVASPPGNKAAPVYRNPLAARIRTAAEAGDSDAQVALGWIYSSGKGVPVDKAEAARWYRLAADNGNINAQVALGWLYYAGQTGERNVAEAALWYGKAAARGNLKARRMLKRIQQENPQN
jgi:TPR repeat protein